MQQITEINLAIAYLSKTSLLGLLAKIKCSICSYQFNIWYGAHSVPHILILFVALGQGTEVYLTPTTSCLGVALQPSAAHFRQKKHTSGTNCLLPIVDPHLKSISEVFYAHHIRYLANLIHGLSQKAEKRWLTSIKCSADNSACCSGTQ